MAAPGKEDPLKVLNQVFGEVLVNTGKVLRSQLDNGSSNVQGTGASVQKKSSGALATWQYALDDLEDEITKAKSVLVRDLEKLRAARAPVPAPTPILPPTPAVVDMPSAAAHTVSVPAPIPGGDAKPVAPFPDMGGGGVSSGVVDLTAGEKKPGVPPTGQPNPVKAEVKPSPKPAPKSTPPVKVTPVPPPQIPRPQQVKPPAPAKPPAAAHPNPPTQTQVPVPSPVPVPVPVPAPGPAPAASAAQNPPPPGSSEPTGPPEASMGAGELNFTDMQFSLAPPPTSDAQNAAPPAPMADFDLSSFAPQGGNNDLLSSLGDFAPAGGAEGGAGGGGNGATEPAKETGKNDTSNTDDLFDFGDGGTAGEGMDLDLDLGGSGMDSSNFNDMFIDNNNDADMGNMQFDNAFFGLD